MSKDWNWHVDSLHTRLKELQDTLGSIRSLVEDRPGLDAATRAIASLLAVESAAQIHAFPSALNEILSNPLIGALLLGPKGDIVLYNSIADSLLGSEFLRAGIMDGTGGLEFRSRKSDVIGQDSLPWMRALKGEAVPDERLQVAKGSGQSSMWINSSATPFIDSNGAVSGVVVFFIDTTEEVEVAESIENVCNTIGGQISEVADSHSQLRDLADRLSNTGVQRILSGHSFPSDSNRDSAEPEARDNEKKSESKESPGESPEEASVEPVAAESAKKETETPEDLFGKLSKAADDSESEPLDVASETDPWPADSPDAEEELWEEETDAEIDSKVETAEEVHEEPVSEVEAHEDIAEPVSAVEEDEVSNVESHEEPLEPEVSHDYRDSSNEFATDDSFDNGFYASEEVEEVAETVEPVAEEHESEDHESFAAAEEVMEPEEVVEDLEPEYGQSGEFAEVGEYDDAPLDVEEETFAAEADGEYAEPLTAEESYSAPSASRRRASASYHRLQAMSGTAELAEDDLDDDFDADSQLVSYARDEHQSEYGDAPAVLIVDDIPVNQELLRLHFGRLGYRAAIANNGQEALDMLTDGRYSLIVMDCEMPVMDGFETARRIRSNQSYSHDRVPIIGVSSHEQKDELEHCISAGMDDCVSRSASFNEYRQSLDSILVSRGEDSHYAESEDPDIRKYESRPVSTNTIKELYGDEEQDRICRLFVDNVSTYIDCMQDSIEKKSGESVAYFAESIRGVAGALGMRQLVRLATDIISYSESGDWMQVRVKFKRLEAIFQQKTGEIRALIRS